MSFEKLPVVLHNGSYAVQTPMGMIPIAILAARGFNGSFVEDYQLVSGISS
jgi:hypothetical protein